LLKLTKKNEALLKHWKKQLEWDVENQNEIELSSEEWSLVQEGITDYKNGKVISLQEFVSKRKRCCIIKSFYFQQAK
jgi:hypothetical protein